MKVLKTPSAPRYETVVLVLLMTAEQLAMYLGLLLEAGTQGLASCLVFFFPKAAENKTVTFVLRGAQKEIL